MNTILALSPQVSDGLLELTLESAGIAFEYLQRVQTGRQLAEMDLMIIDPDQPGQDFLLRYRKLYEARGSFPLVVLGPRTHITLKMIPWDPAKTVFLDGEQVLKKLEAFITSRSGKPQPTPATSVSAPVSSEKTVELFKGLKSIQLADIVQMLCLSRWTGEIRIHCRKSDQAGRLSLMVGEIVNAITPEHKAENACYEMLSWKSCEFHFLEGAKSYPRMIHAGWEAILMEAACRIDESQAQVS